MGLERAPREAPAAAAAGRPSDPPCRNSPDFFEAWRTLPLAFESEDPRIEVRRASESDFPRIFDLVDAAVGTKRPREVYDWLYRRNPRGLARCWIATERETGRIVGNNARFAWPIQLGAEQIDGYNSGDNAVAPDWQRRGVMRQIWLARDSHPWTADETVIGWPNARTLGAQQKHGNVATASEPLEARALPLRGSGAPAGLKAAATRVAASVLKAWSGLALRGGDGIRVEEVGRFDAALDSVAARSSAFHGFWCRRSADFLNWRYLAHPGGGYVAYAAFEAERPVGYCVVGIANGRATLMELADVGGSGRVARTLLQRAIRTARASGCSAIQHVATPSFRHWPLLRRAGFLRVTSEFFPLLRGEAHPGLGQIANWQLGPGDVDTL